ncbi:MAG: isoprenylcysteine carboxylmethyltransferase family protein [Paludibacteraceae bacterium]|nr:isoprenylcysteine carboxylmethyltransferase family protein [Paludibacteraceae bacterium]
MKKLLLKAIIKFLSGVLAVGLFLFLPAGTWYYPNGWLFCALLFVPMLFTGIWLFLKEPDLLSKRLNSKEQESEQKWVIALSSLMFVGGFVLCGLAFRFGWSHLPVAVVAVAAIVMLAGYMLYAFVMKQNAYLSRTVEVQENQKVISTGLYGIVRHPMYTATLLLFLSMPLVLGSFYAFLLFLIYPFVLVKRIKNEEAVLEKGLQGYTAYKQKVKYKIIPFIW